MRLIEFSVQNYKVFNSKFTINLANDSIAILTGRNNTGKSTILEAINHFYQRSTKAKIPTDCFSNSLKSIIMTAKFEIEEQDEPFLVIKKYENNKVPVFYDIDDNKVERAHESVPMLEKILENQPFYITPSMLPDDINDLIQLMYSGIMKSRLEELEADTVAEVDEELAKEYAELKKSIPDFLGKIKLETDGLLNGVSENVSNNLRTLFSNEQLALKIVGGESGGFTSADILKTTSSSVHVVKSPTQNMPLANQGTGLQRMSLIYLIQNMIETNLLGNSENKLLLIDEPEAFLHPEAVRALSRSLYKIGQEMPLMISTHSPVLIDLSEQHTSIQVFKVSSDSAIEIYKSDTDLFNEDDIKNIKILNYTDSYVNEFFFAEKILIVEGDTEYIAFKQIAKERDENLHIIRARGKATICTLMKILNQFKTSYVVIHDVDNEEDRNIQGLKTQLTNCKKILAEKLAVQENSDIKIFCSISNFEVAIGLGQVESKQKTKKAYEVLHLPEHQDIRLIIEAIYDSMIYNQPLTLGSFSNINSNEDYEQFFTTLVQ